MCVVALLLGMLLFHMLKGVCGCKLTEGQVGGLCGAVLVDRGEGESPLTLAERHWLADKDALCSDITTHGHCINEHGCQWVVTGAPKPKFPPHMTAGEFRAEFGEASRHHRKNEDASGHHRGHHRMPSFHQSGFFSRHGLHSR